MILGDFNLMRNPNDRYRIGGDTNNMLLFSTIIQAHDLEEIPLEAREILYKEQHATISTSRKT
jgi:hypothetical protein